MFGGRRAAVALSSLVLVGSTVVWAPAGEAHGGGAHGGADRGGVVCTGTSHGTHEPPLTLVPHRTRIHVKADYTCTVAPGRTLQAKGSLKGVAPAAFCLGQPTSHPTEVVRYADGTRSVIAYDHGTTLRVADVLVTRVTGRVTEGRGKGLPARRTTDALSGQLPTECLASGLREVSGSTVLETGP